MDDVDRIAFLRVQLEILNDLEPDGEWKQSNLLQKWQANHYSLTRGEIERLCTYLNHQRELAAYSRFSREYSQLNILAGEEP